MRNFSSRIGGDIEEDIVGNIELSSILIEAQGRVIGCTGWSARTSPPSLSRPADLEVGGEMQSLISSHAQGQLARTDSQPA
jgi:hypothetical protein